MSTASRRPASSILRPRGGLSKARQKLEGSLAGISADEAAAELATLAALEPPSAAADGHLESPFLGVGLAVAGAWLVAVVWRALRVPDGPGLGRAFRAINYYAVMVMGAVIVDALLAGW